MRCYGVNRFEPPQVFIMRVNVAAVEEAVNIPAFIEKVRYWDCTVRGAANVKENILAHWIFLPSRYIFRCDKA